MDYAALFLVLVLTTQTTSLHHHCNSDVHPPASGVADLKQNSTLQYCLIDNCTIMRIDTGQQLDIVYTTQSLLIVTPTDGQTSMIIPKNKPELFCLTYNDSDDDFNIQFIGRFIVAIVLLVSGYIVAVHLIFKQLRSTFGKLMMSQNIFIVCQCISIIVLSTVHHDIAFQSITPCYLAFFLYMQSILLEEGFATCILAYLAYIMHLSYRSRQLTEAHNKNFYRNSIKYVLGSLLLFNIFIVSYDFGTGAYKYTLLPNGHCSLIRESQYDTIRIVHANGILNKSLQILSLVVYFVYNYKLNKKLKMVRSLAVNSDREQNRIFFKIAVIMGATIGISQFISIVSWYFERLDIVSIAGLFFIIQQCLIMSLYMCSEKMLQLCKQKFSSTVTPV